LLPRSKPSSPRTTIESRQLACKWSSCQNPTPVHTCHGLEFGRSNLIHRLACFTPWVDGASLNTSSITLSLAFYVFRPGRVSGKIWRDRAESHMSSYLYGTMPIGRSTTNGRDCASLTIRVAPVKRMIIYTIGPCQTGSYARYHLLRRLGRCP
jgi:hypothetical protein